MQKVGNRWFTVSSNVMSADNKEYFGFMVVVFFHFSSAYSLNWVVVYSLAAQAAKQSTQVNTGYSTKTASKAAGGKPKNRKPDIDYFDVTD